MWITLCEVRHNLFEPVLPVLLVLQLPLLHRLLLLFDFLQRHECRASSPQKSDQLVAIRARDISRYLDMFDVQFPRHRAQRFQHCGVLEELRVVASATDLVRVLVLVQEQDCGVGLSGWRSNSWCSVRVECQVCCRLG